MNIEILQQQIHKKRDELIHLEQTLQERYDQIAQNLCPFKIGDEIEYEPGKKGIVEKIYYPREGCDCSPLEEEKPDYWAVTGKKINKNGHLGLKEYKEISNKTHTINGSVCQRMSVKETLFLKCSI
jgi:hypothetical protein